MSVFSELPPDTYQLASADVEPFVDTLRQDYGISKPVATVCTRILSHVFNEYGGYDEPATNDGALSLAYHNGSHAAYVMACTVWLLAKSGASSPEVDLGAVCGAGHDYRHRSRIPGEDERETVVALTDLLSVSQLPRLARGVTRPILGTIVEKIDKTGISQRAAKSKDRLSQSLADADLSALASPFAGEWALRLYAEETRAADKPLTRAGAKLFLENTVNLQRNHCYTSALARRRFQPMAKRQADILQERIPELVADMPAGDS